MVEWSPFPETVFLSSSQKTLPEQAVIARFVWMWQIVHLKKSTWNATSSHLDLRVLFRII
jgi:hypothetical protein